MSDLSMQERNDKIIYLYTQYAKTIFNRCFVLVHNYDLAEDCMQETFARLSKSYDAIADKSNIVGWLMNTAVYVCREAVRKNSSETAYLSNLKEQMEQDQKKGVSADASPEFPFEVLEEAEFYQSLSPEYQLIYDLRFRRDMRIADVAKEMGCSVGAAKMRIKRLLKCAEKYFMKKTNKF